MIKRFIFSIITNKYSGSGRFYCVIDFLSLNISAFRENLDENTQFVSKLRIKKKINAEERFSMVSTVFDISLGLVLFPAIFYFFQLILQRNCKSLSQNLIYDIRYDL